jgi:uncharacterized protein (DUF1778 family)
MSAISIRLPKRYHDRIRELAKKEGISINQFVTLAVGEKISALDTENYLSNRAKQADQQKFLNALSKVREVPPSYPEDQLD